MRNQMQINDIKISKSQNQSLAHIGQKFVN